MTEDKDKIKKLYDTFVADGYDMESEDDFRKNMSDAKKRKAAYDALVNDGYEMEPFDVFESNIGYGKQQQSSTVAKAAPASTPQKEQPWRPTEQEKIRMSQDLNRMMAGVKQSTEEFNERIDNMREYGFTPGLQTKEAKRQFNPESGKMEQTYITPAGNRYNNKAVADMESFRYRQAADMSVGGQIRRLNSRLRDIEGKLDERGRLLLEEHERNKPSGFVGFIAEMGKAVAGDKMGGNYVDNPEDYAEFVNDNEYQSLRLAARQAREELQRLENARDKEQNGERFWHDFGRNTWQAIANVDAWDFGKNKLRDATTTISLAGRADNTDFDQLSEADQVALEEMYFNNAVMEQFGDLGTGARWGDIAGGSLSFMKDFLITGGFSGVTTKLPTTMATRFATKAATKAGIDASKSIGIKVAEKGLFNTLRQGGKGVAKRLLAEQGVGGTAKILATKAIGVTAEDLLIRAPLMTTTVQGQNTAADIIQTKLGLWWPMKRATCILPMRNRWAVPHGKHLPTIP